MWRAFGAVVLLALSSCAAPGTAPSASGCPAEGLDDLNTPHPTNEAPSYAGTGRFVLQPERPTLVPNETVVLHLTFTNSGPCTFFYRDQAIDCSNTLVRIGRESFFLYGWNGSLTLNAPVFHSCGVLSTIRWKAIEAGATFTAQNGWDGSFPLWDHSSVASGRNWTKRTFWAAPGDWPLGFGFDRFTSFAVAGESILHVEETDLNRGSPVHPDGCSALRGEDGRFSNVNITLSRSQATIGTPISIHANYTLDLPATGCYIFAGEPMAEWTQGGSRRHSLGGRCAHSYSLSDPFVVIVQANETSIPVHLSYTWDGSGAQDLGGCRSAAAPGPSFFGFAEPISVGTSERTQTPFEWLAP